MRKDRRNVKIRRHVSERCYYLHYKGNKIKLQAGLDDIILIFRYGDDFFLLEYHELLDYAGFELISKDMENLQDEFFQNVTEFSEETGFKKHLFDYCDAYKADLLAQWIQ